MKNIDATMKFYRRTLGLKKSEDICDDVAICESGNSTMWSTRPNLPEPNKPHPRQGGVGDELESITKNLRKEGIAFEYNNMPGLARRGDIRVSGDFKAAWFKAMAPDWRPNRHCVIFDTAGSPIPQAGKSGF